MDQVRRTETIPTGFRGLFFSQIYLTTGIFGSVIAWAMSFHLGLLALLGWPIGAVAGIAAYALYRNDIEPVEVRFVDDRFQVVPRRRESPPWEMTRDARIFSWGKLGGAVAVGRSRNFHLWYLNHAQVETFRSRGAVSGSTKPQ